jgi:hypothetical protein
MVTLKEPYRKDLSENAAVYYGYKDGHVVVKVRLPVPLRPWWPVNVTTEELVTFRATFAGALSFGEGKSGLMLIDPIEIDVMPDCKVKWGYKDLHLDLGIRKLGVWLWWKFSFEELKNAKVALEEAYKWYLLPKETRELQGVDG